MEQAPVYVPNADHIDPRQTADSSHRCRLSVHSISAILLILGVPLNLRIGVSLAGLALFYAGIPHIIGGHGFWLRFLALMIVVVGLMVFALFSGVIIPDEDLQRLLNWMFMVAT